MTAAITMHAGGLCLDTGLHRYLLGPLDVWRVIEANSICISWPWGWEKPPQGRCGGLDDETVFWETPDGTFLIPRDTARAIMRGELAEAVAVPDRLNGRHRWIRRANAPVDDETVFWGPEGTASD